MLFTGAGGSGKKVKKTSARKFSRLKEEEAEKYEQEIHEAEAAELEQENRDRLTNLAS
jgi:hypothetical protein